MIALVTDSASQIPPSLAAEFGVRVAPIIVNIDGVEYREGVDLTADDFWAQVSNGEVPEITTSQPSPGTFSEIYRSAVEQGATDIVSVHVGAEHSGTINSARIAAQTVDVDVHVVDSGTASFGVTCCVWEAASAIAAGASVAEVVARVERMRPDNRHGVHPQRVGLRSPGRPLQPGVAVRQRTRRTAKGSQSSRVMEAILRLWH